MSDSQPLFAALREVADADVAAAIEDLVTSGADRDLARINVLAFAAALGLDEERAIGRTSRPSASSRTRRSATFIAPTRSRLIRASKS